MIFKKNIFWEEGWRSRSFHSFRIPEDVSIEKMLPIVFKWLPLVAKW